jgi:hypothetical protein
VVEAAEDPASADMNLGVFGHHDGDGADDGSGVDGRLAVDEPGLAEVDLAAAYHRQPPEGASHHPPALALESGDDPRVSRRGGYRAWLWRRSSQVVHDRSKFGVSPGRIGRGQPLLQLRHGQPPVGERRPQRGRDALAVGVGRPGSRYGRALLRPWHLRQVPHPASLRCEQPRRHDGKTRERFGVP